MKVSKGSLKKLIKECLIEILTEDFIENLVERKLLESGGINNVDRSHYPKTSSSVQNISNDVSREFLSNFRTGQKKEIKTDITNNPIINEVLADTARTTLPKMLAEENKGAAMRSLTSGQSVSTNYESGDEVDGDSRWSQVAFAPIKRPGQ